MIDVKKFGAIGDGVADDTDAIQNALDSIQVPIAMSAGKMISGDTCYLPTGIYKISRSLKLRTAVTMRGDGLSSKIVATNCHAIALNTPFGHRYFECGGIENLSIFTEGSIPHEPALPIPERAKGISIDETVGLITALKVQNVLFECEGICIDLKGIYSQNCLLDRIYAMNCSSGLLWIEGNANVIREINSEGAARDPLTVDTAVMVIKGGGNSIENCIIEGYPRGNVAYFCEGMIAWRNNWMELPPNRKDNICYVFNNCSGSIDDLHLVNSQMKVKFKNCVDLRIGVISTDGDSAVLSQVIEMDEDSRIEFDHVRATWDSGMLDDPRVMIRSIYSKSGKWQLRNPLSLKNCIPSTAFVSPAVWTKNFGTHNTIQFDVSTDNSPGRIGRRLKIKCTANPDNDNFGVQIPLNVSADDSGTPGVLKMRLEGPSQMICWQIQGPNWQQPASRAMGSLTSSRLPLPLLTGDTLMFIATPKVGDVFYISGLECGPELF